MEQSEKNPEELRLKIERASRLASGITDDATSQRLKQFVEELKENLQRILATRRSEEAIRARAKELWESSGRPPDRDLEFWVKAEQEMRERSSTRTDPVPG